MLISARYVTYVIEVVKIHTVERIAKAPNTGTAGEVRAVMHLLNSSTRKGPGAWFGLKPLIMKAATV